MKSKIVKEKIDLTYLKWSHARSSSGTAGTFLKSESVTEGRKIYYKLSDFDSLHGVVGHECVNEIIVDRLLEVLGVPHLSYELINAFEILTNLQEKIKKEILLNNLCKKFYFINAF